MVVDRTGTDVGREVMPYQEAFTAIRRALDTQQIGTPVAVRMILQAVEQPEQLDACQTIARQTILQWLDDALAAEFVVDHREAGELSSLLRTTRGRTALVSVGVCHDSAPLVEILVFGSRGVLSWEGHDRRLALVPTQIPQTKSPAPAGGKEVRGEAVKKLGQAPRSYAKSLQNTDIHSEPVPFFYSLGAQLASRRTEVKSPPLAPPYGVLLVAGEHTHQPGYAEAFLADGRGKLIGVADEADVSPARQQLNQRFAEHWGIPVLPRLDEALRRDDVHIVSVCAEPYRRGRIIAAAARAGKHLYLDKPLAATLEDVAAIVDAVRETGVVAHMFSQVHFDPAQRARALVESGQLGELVAVHCDLCFAKGHGGTADLSQPRRETAVPTRFELPDAKRELTNVGVYAVTLLLWLLGRDVRRVHATTSNFFFAEHQTRDMEDFGQMLLELEGGLTATVTAGRAGWRSHPSGGIHRVCLVGTQGSVTIDAHRPRVEVWADIEPWQAPPRDPEDPLGMWFARPDSPYLPREKNSWVLPTAANWRTDVAHFLDCVEHGRASEVPLEIAAYSTEILLAGYRSAATGQPVELPLTPPL